MNFMDLLNQAGGSGSIGALSKQLGIGSSDAGKLVEALGPALARGLQKQTENPATLDGLTKALASGNHQRYLDEPESVGGNDAVIDGNKILGHLFGSKDVSRNVAAQAAEQTGMESSLIKKALPILAGLAMGALSKKGQSADGGSDLGGLLGNLLGGGGNGGLDLDDVLGLARKFF
jgi:hypothetical protein